MASNETSPWPTITLLGVFCGITFGLLLYSILRRKDGEGGAGLDMGDFDATPLPSPKSFLKAPVQSSAARTMRISETSYTPILRAQGGNWKVSVRVLSPNGASATFRIGIDANSTVIVPQGESQELWLKRDQYLYAKGSEAGVCVSAAGGPL